LFLANKTIFDSNSRKFVETSTGWYFASTVSLADKKVRTTCMVPIAIPSQEG
jgi:hypothetical protein